MELEWDEAKRLSNLAKHEIDFQAVAELFDGRPVVVARSSFADEARYETTGIFKGRFTTIIWTPRANSIRIISARRARDGERRTYRELHDG